MWQTPSGLPRLPSFATKPQDEQLSAQDLEVVPEAIHSVLNWLDRIASSLKQHQTTPEYQDALRKSGVAHGESGLTATELETRTAARQAKFDIGTARKLNARQTLTFTNWHRWQKKAPPCLMGWLAAATPGRALKPRRWGDAMCRTPLHTL